MHKKEFKVPHHGRISDCFYYKPDNMQPGEKCPVVIFSHGFDGYKRDFRTSAKYYAGAGICGVCHGFCGGGRRDDASGFSTTQMNHFTEMEDLISIGTIGLIKAINTFNVNKNIKLATYASRCIENEILMYLRRNNKTKFEVSIDEPLNVDWDGNELLLSDILGTEEDVIYRDLENEVDKKLLKRAISTLSDREKLIISLRFGINTKNGEEKTQKEVADILGISQSYISRLEKKIMKRLKREMLKLS